MNVNYMTWKLDPERREKLVTTFGESDIRDLELDMDATWHKNAVYGFRQGIVKTVITELAVVGVVAGCTCVVQHIKKSKKNKAKM